MAAWLSDRINTRCEIRINTLDDSDTANEQGIYLTVTGLSAEHGDDGQVGRGNRVSGLITSSRPMSLEAAAGKNPVNHVGKIYNVLAPQLANDLVAQMPGGEEAQVQLLSAIGRPINRAQLATIEVATRDGSLNGIDVRRVEQLVQAGLDDIRAVSDRLARGEYHVF